MAQELPLACTLTGADMAARGAEIQAVGREGLLDAQAEETRAILRFRPGSRDRVAAIVAKEAECCAFLSMRLDDEPDAVRLTIEAPPGGEPVMHDLVAAFSA
jgi:hypothetical protein